MSNGYVKDIKKIIDDGELPERVSNRLILSAVVEMMTAHEKHCEVLTEKLNVLERVVRRHEEHFDAFEKRVAKVEHHISPNTRWSWSWLKEKLSEPVMLVPLVIILERLTEAAVQYWMGGIP